jgi:hypothetical protein
LGLAVRLEDANCNEEAAHLCGLYDEMTSMPRYHYRKAIVEGRRGHARIFSATGSPPSEGSGTATEPNGTSHDLAETYGLNSSGQWVGHDFQVDFGLGQTP